MISLAGKPVVSLAGISSILAGICLILAGVLHFLPVAGPDRNGIFLVKSFPGRLTLSWQDNKIKHFQLSWQDNNIPGRIKLMPGRETKANPARKTIHYLAGLLLVS